MNHSYPRLRLSGVSRRGVALAAGLLVTGLLAAGCSGSSSPKQTATQAAPVLRCSIAPDTTVGSTLGLQINPSQESNQTPVTVCTYPLKDGTGVVLLRFQTVVDQGVFAEIRKGFASPTTDLSGFKEQAFTSTAGTGAGAVNSVAARQGSVAIVVTSKATVDKEEALVTQLFANL